MPLPYGSSEVAQAFAWAQLLATITSVFPSQVMFRAVSHQASAVARSPSRSRGSGVVSHVALAGCARGSCQEGREDEQRYCGDEPMTHGDAPPV
jgi:hypothetical protein